MEERITFWEIVSSWAQQWVSDENDLLNRTFLTYYLDSTIARRDFDLLNECEDGNRIVVSLIQRNGILRKEAGLPSFFQEDERGDIILGNKVVSADQFSKFSFHGMSQQEVFGDIG